MTEDSKITAQSVRAWLEANAAAEPLNMMHIYEGVGVAPGEARQAVSVAVRDATRAGFLARIETPAGPVYQVTGNGMPRVVLSPEERQSRRKARDAGRDRTGRKQAKPRAPRAVRTREARVAVQAANTPVPAVVKPKVRTETVEQFQARGGCVEVLRSIWDRAAA